MELHQPTHDEIAECAYFLWEERGQPYGQDTELWLEAERLLRPAFNKYDVVLTDAGENPVKLVREIRGATGLDLKSVKKLVSETPRTVRQSMSANDADTLLSAIQEAGARAELRPAQR